MLIQFQYCNVFVWNLNKQQSLVSVLASILCKLMQFNLVTKYDYIQSKMGYMYLSCVSARLNCGGMRTAGDAASMVDYSI